MAQNNTEIITIPLNQGIISNAPPFDVGPRLISSTNALWGWRYPAVDDSFAPDHYPPHFLRIPTTFPYRAAITYGSSPTQVLDIGFTHHDSPNRRKVVMGTIGITDEVRLWEAETGTIIGMEGGLSGDNVTAGANPEPGCSVYWAYAGNAVDNTNITEGTFFFSHPSMAEIFYLVDSANTGSDIRSMYQDPIANAPNGATALCVHLDRLWMASGDHRNAKIWYSDPFDAETIRPESFVTIADAIKAITPTVPGDIDATGQAHLFVGCTNSIWIVDGDPSSNTAVRRQVAAGIGVAGNMAVCRSPYGVFFVGTDNQIHLMPPDGRQIIDIGTPIGDIIGYNPNTTELANPRTALCWFPPYLYYFPGGNTVTCHIADLSNPSQPLWWGPIASNLSTDVGFIRATNESSTHSPSGLPSQAIYSVSNLGGGSVSFAGFDAYTKALGSYPNGHEYTDGIGSRVQSITTGHINRPGYRTVIKAVVLETLIKAAAYTWTVTVVNELQASKSFGRTIGTDIPTSATRNSNHIVKHFYVPLGTDIGGAAGEKVRIVISGDVDTVPLLMDLVRLRVVVQYIALGNNT
jgi:hypothetical protein